MSNIKSASSRTKCFNKAQIDYYPAYVNLTDRPGVAIKISTPFLRISFCGSIDAPPKTTADLRLVYLLYRLKSSLICIASSRVGLTINALLFFSLFFPSFCLSYSNCKIGKAKAAVLPVPVWAEAITSFLSKIKGMLYS